MLANPSITALLPSTNLELSKNFYLNTLGLKLKSEDPYGIEFEGNGTRLRISIVHELTVQPFTVLGFKIENIANQISALRSKGVKFENYNSLDQDELGIWASPSQAKIAWFKDPDGNLISLTEYPI